MGHGVHRFRGDVTRRAEEGFSQRGIRPSDPVDRVRPDVIVTQMLCDVCAVADGEAMRLARVMDPPPRVVALDGRTLDGVWDDIARLGEAIGRADEGKRLAGSPRREVAQPAVATPRTHPRRTPRSSMP